ncbi:helix-turn-helix transcriptional regulator [Gordonia sp. (in: high G+C Gram-positive bacteria)]|uniref:helix-turn-helix transcriptional regulator n=1 Tax=Gordonia sp. (in: high G+C Gram-positive bacteria) TaxID=84139 RepID=UPI003C768803
MRATILNALRNAEGPMTVADLATITGIPATTVRFHLHALIDDGVVAADPEPRSGRGRPRMLYRSHAVMDPSGARNFVLLAEVMVEALAAAPNAVEHALEAGRAWGERQAATGSHPVADLVATLDNFGFAPEPAGDGIRLNSCPFLELAKSHPTVTCAVHRGIMQGVLASHDTPLRLERLDAFVDGDHCMATLTGETA